MFLTSTCWISTYTRRDVSSRFSLKPFFKGTDLYPVKAVNQHLYFRLHSFAQCFTKITGNEVDRLTRANTFHRERSLGQEIGVREHVLLKDHKAQKGEVWFIHAESKCLWRLRVLPEPYRVQSIIICGHRYIHTIYRSICIWTHAQFFIILAADQNIFQLQLCQKYWVTPF